MNYVLRIIAAVIIAVSMFQSASWVASISDSNAVTAVLVAFVVALEAAKATFIVLSTRYFGSKQFISGGVYGFMALLLMSFSFTASLSNLSGWNMEQSEVQRVSAVEDMLQANQQAIDAATAAMSAGYVSKTEKLLESLTDRREALLKEKTGIAVKPEQAETMAYYMMIVLSLSVELVSFLCLLAIGRDKNTEAVEEGHEVEVLGETSYPVEAETKPVPEQPVMAEAMATTMKPVVLSIRQIKTKYHCGYERAKEIQQQMVAQTWSEPVQLSLVS